MFTPALKASLNPETGENGAEILTIALLVDGERESLMPIDLGSINSSGDLLVNSVNTVYLGIQIVRIRYKMQDYLNETIFDSEFSLEVKAKPPDDQYTVVARPEFKLNEYAKQYNVTAGEYWE